VVSKLQHKILFGKIRVQFLSEIFYQTLLTLQPNFKLLEPNFLKNRRIKVKTKTKIKTHFTLAWKLRPLLSFSRPKFEVYLKVNSKETVFIRFKCNLDTSHKPFDPWILWTNLLKSKVRWITISIFKRIKILPCPLFIRRYFLKV
jgi:hypothetical protein